jgi:hypothetical protein
MQNPLWPPAGGDDGTYRPYQPLSEFEPQSTARDRALFFGPSWHKLRSAEQYQAPDTKEILRRYNELSQLQGPRTVATSKDLTTLADILQLRGEYVDRGFAEPVEPDAEVQWDESSPIYPVTERDELPASIYPVKKRDEPPSIGTAGTDAGVDSAAADAGNPYAVDAATIERMIARRRAADAATADVTSLPEETDGPPLSATDGPPPPAALDGVPSSAALDAAEKIAVDNLRERMFRMSEDQDAVAVPFESIESIEARRLALLARRQKSASAYEIAELQRIKETDETGAAAVANIRTVMDDAKKFAKGGKLPEKLQDQYVNDLLMSAGGALLGNPTWHQAGAAFIEAGMKVKDKYRKDYAESLHTLLTNETQLQTLTAGLADARAASQAALAKSMFEFRRGDEDAGTALEAAATKANNDAAQMQILLDQAQSARLTSMASVLNALYPDRRRVATERTIEVFFDQLWSQGKGDPALRDEWFFKGPDGTYSRENFRGAKYIAEYKSIAKSQVQPGVLPTGVRIEATGLSRAKSQGITAWVAFKDADFTGDIGKKAKPVMEYLNNNFGYNFTTMSPRSELRVVPKHEFLRAWLHTHHSEQIKPGGEWREEYDLSFPTTGAAVNLTEYDD